MNEKEYKFSGTIVRSTYNTPDFKIYAVDVDKQKYPDVKHTKYGNVSILGELSDLTEGVEYDITATEQTSKYGISYRVLNIKRDMPTTAEDMQLFLQEILTPNQARVLYENYPDIVQRVKENRLDDIDLNKLKGIKEYTFNVIKNKIIENFCLADLVIEFQGYLNLSIIKKIYNKYSSIDVLREKLKKDPYKCLCGLAGVGFKTADGLLLDMEKASKANIKKGKNPIIEFESDLKSSPQRCLSCLLYLLAENENEGHTKMNLADLRAECIKLVPACASHFADEVQSNSIYYDKTTMDVALSKTYNIEKEIADTILTHSKDCNNIWDYDVEKYRNVGEFDLSDEQVNTMKLLCQNNIVILTACAGSGKSNSIKGIINMLDDNKKTYKLMTPTGKSSKVLKEFTERKSTTIHRGLCYCPELIYYKNGNRSNSYDFDYSTHFSFNKCDKLICDVIVVDEFSMVDIFLCKSLFEAIDFTKTKLLLVGDSAQIPSVQCGCLLNDFVSSGIIAVSYLTKIFRYGDNGLMKVATDTRLCKPYLSNSMKSKMTSFGSDKDYIFVDLDSDSIPKNATALYKRLLDKGFTQNDIQVLTAKNVGDCGTVVLNNMIQKIANSNYGKTVFMKIGDTTYFENDLVIQKVNNYKAELDLKSIEDESEREFYENQDDIPTAFIANGETGCIKEIYNSYVIIDFDGVIVKYYRNDMNMIGLGYAITIHKSQGSSIKVVILCTPRSHTFMLNSNLLYTGLTRTKKCCYHLGNINTVNLAITKKADTQRNTFMIQMLTNED